MRFARLPLRFDAAALARDVAGLGEADWQRHFNTGYHDGGWTGIAFRAPGGDPAKLYAPVESGAQCVDTPVRARCPAIDAALDAFGPCLRSARLLRLAAGSCIREHRDCGLSLESGEARLHVPVTTGPGVEFYLEGELVVMEPGECWYLDLDRPHRVQNLGARERVHLVLDCVADEWLLGQIPDAAALEGQAEELRRRAASVETSQQRLERFRRLALGEPGLVDALAGEADRDRFIDRIVAAGHERGISFTPEDVRAAMDAGRREWAGRWSLR